MSKETPSERFYGDLYRDLEENRKRLQAEAEELQNLLNAGDFMEPILYVSSRIKSPASTVEKCRRKGTTLSGLSDLLGMRIVCAFTSDVYETAAWVRSRFEVLEEEDYYTSPKENGYRSYHMLVRTDYPGLSPVTAEVQIRTIATDFWAALEHQIRYKRRIPEEEILVSELKSCADEAAAVDLRMSTIRNIISQQEIR